MIQFFYWERFSKKVREKIERPRFAGIISPHEAVEKRMRLVLGREKGICLYWLIDESDGIVADAKFQAFGPAALIAALEAASELSIRKNYSQISRISAELIDQHFRDKKEAPAFPKESAQLLNQVLGAIDDAVQQCLDIPLAEGYDMTPIESDFGEIPGGIPGWEKFSQADQIRIIEEVIDKEIRPYIELDAGGVKLLELKEGKEVVIAYEGACTTCHSSSGSTLSAIQQILRARVHPSLFVTPNL